MMPQREREADTAATRVPPRLRFPAAEWMLILVAPPLAWLLFGIVLINQDQQIDSWYYVGYGRAFHTLYEIFGWPYYAVRFPVVILNGLALSGSNPLVGYAVLRYLLILSCGIPLYVWSRATLGRPAAIVGYLFLVSNPLLARVILWDLTTFVSVPMALAGIATWLRSDRVTMRVLSGFLMATSVASHAFTGTAVALFLTVQVIRRLRAREFRGLLVKDIVATGIGAAACFAAGCLYYYVRVGPFDPRVILTTTSWAVRAGHEYARTYTTPFSTWAMRDYHVYVPFLCIAMAGVLLGRRVIRNTAVASVWWFALAYAIAYLVYQFIFGRFILETFYYFAHLSLTVYLLVPVIVSELTEVPSARTRRDLSVAAISALLALPLLQRVVPRFGLWLDTAGHSNVAMLTALTVAAGLVVAASRVLLRKGLAVGVLCTFLLIVQAFTFLNPTHRRVFDSSYRARETGVYLAAIQMLDVFAATETPQTRVMLWFCSTQSSLRSLASTVLLYSVSSPWSNEPCDARIGDYERERLSSQKPRYLLLLNEQADAFAAQETALRREGYQVQERLSKAIGDDAYQAALRLVEIRGGTP